jgi:hypothetical protein
MSRFIVLPSSKEKGCAAVSLQLYLSRSGVKLGPEDAKA